MSLVEHIGSEIPRMKRDMLNAGLPEPIFETEGMFTVTFNRPLKQVIQAVNSTFTEIQKAIIAAIKINPSLTMEEIGSVVGLGRTTIYQNIKILKEIGILRRVGRKMDGKWQIVE